MTNMKYKERCRNGKCHEENCGKCGRTAWMYIRKSKVCAICGHTEKL